MAWPFRSPLRAEETSLRLRIRYPMQPPPQTLPLELDLSRYPSEWYRHKPLCLSATFHSEPHKRKPAAQYPSTVAYPQEVQT